jgi:hypothetical protein
MRRWIAPAIGAVAILALLGAIGLLPGPFAFFISALAIIFFPGIAVTRLIAGALLDEDTFPERLAAWFVMGIGLVSAGGLVGLILRLNLSDLMLSVAICYTVLAVALILRKAAAPDTRIGTVIRHRGQVARIVSFAVLAIAIGLALLTLITPRDYDDWYYLAYIKDFVAGTPLASEDAIFDMGQPATPRIWFGGGWWVLEALLSKVSGIDPVACHQIFLPLLILPLAVLAVYTLAMRIFRSTRAALLACGFQMLFYLSSAYPYKSAGWMVFARIAQDKAVAFFVVVPVAAALGLRLIRQAEDHPGKPPGGLTYLYWFAVFTSVLIHGMGPVWLGLMIVPFALIAWYRTRTKGYALATTTRVLLPLILCAVVLVSARDTVREFVVAPVPEQVPAPGILSGLYLPGYAFGLGTDTTNPTTWFFHEGFQTLNPLFITRYPLAMAGLVLTLGLFRYFRSSFAARFLLAATVPTLLLLFTPPGIRLAAWFLTPRLVFRLSWVFPWGLVIAFFLTRLRMGPYPTILVLLGLVLGLARGNPANYGRAFRTMRERNRPSAEAVAAFAYLASQPSPQGVILASEATGRMIPAFLPHGYPVNFREFGPVTSEKLAEIVATVHMRPELLAEIQRNHVNYILIENEKPLARALGESDAGFVLEYSNASYGVWHR